jgi:arylsulfatase A
MATMRPHGAATRRDFLRLVGASVAAGMSYDGAAAGYRRDLPNIVLILADDMGFGDVACQNPDSKIPTPNLDRLARQGRRFTDAHSPSAVCTPTRYALLTGRYCWRTALKEQVLWAWDGPLIEPERLTLPAMLRQHGYHTACIGKWHLGWEWPATDGSSVNDQVPMGVQDPKIRDPFGDKVDFSRPIGGGPTTRGFDYYFGDDMPNFAPYCFIENDRVTAQPTERKPPAMFGTPGPMAPGWKLDAVMPALTEKAVAYIEADAGTAPFFLYFPLTAPHTPIAPAEEFLGASQAHRYGDFVHQVDDTVGRILQALEESGQADNTLVIFTSDNGSPARDGTNMSGPARSVLEYGHNPSHIYRGIKTDIWDGGHRVPFIARWPQRFPPGTVSEELICLTDIMATLAGILGHDLPDHAAEDSYCILPALLGDAYDGPVRKAIVHHSYYGMFAIRQGPWKLILGQGSGGWDREQDESYPPGQLYHMINDPAEQHNRYDDYPAIVARLEARLDKYRRESRSVSR